MATFTEQFIAAAVSKFGGNFKAPEKTKLISTAWGTMRVRCDSETTIQLPNGEWVRVWTDASGKATQVEEDDSLHAIVRPDVYRPRVRLHQ